ncbi:MAG TPA: TolC family protein [Blastocatellia bacterium]|nr:TolC family protein [Blastocatellia bacterium]
MKLDRVIRRCRAAFGAAIMAVVAISAPAQVVSLTEDRQDQTQPAQPPAPIQLRRVGVNESNPLSLTLFDAVKLALENNQEIEVDRINVRQAEYDLFAANGARDVTLTSNSFFEHRTVPVGSVLAGGPNGTLTTDTFSYDFAAQQLVSTGGQWTAQFTNSRVDSNSQFSSLNPQYNAGLALQFRQPLARNRSIDESRRRIGVARKRLDQSDSQFRQRAIETVSRVQRAYWDLAFALRDLQIRRESIDLARNQLERNQRMVKEGTLAPVELISVEVELERRKDAALSALDGVTRAENALKQLILGDRQSQTWQRPLMPADSPAVNTPALTLDEATSVAFHNRPEITQNELQQEINKVDVSFFANQTRPQVDLLAVYGTTGLAGTAVPTGSPFVASTVVMLTRVNELSSLAGLPPVVLPPQNQLPNFLLGGNGQSLSNLFGNDFRTWRVGLAFNFPLRNRTAEAQLGRSVAEGRKIDSRRKSLEQSIEAEVRDALQAVDTARLRIETARASRVAAEQQLDSEQRRFAAGMSTNFLVLERQNALSEAQGRELRALTDYNKAISELQRVMGTTLTASNVELK